MQINVNTYTPLLKSYKFSKETYNKNVSYPVVQNSTNLNFLGATTVTRTVSSKISLEKDKILRNLKTILATNVPEKTVEGLMYEMFTRAHAIINSKKRRLNEIEKELLLIAKSKILNPQQKYDMAIKLRKEIYRLEKFNPFELPKKETNANTKDENFDYLLINKFKNAVLNDNFNFATIYSEHYSELADLTSVEDVKAKYPYIKLPAHPQNVIINKIVETLPRKFYEELDVLFKEKDSEAVKEYLIGYLKNNSVEYSKACGITDVAKFINMFGENLTKKILDIYADIFKNNSFNSIPIKRKNTVPDVTTLDKEMLALDYNSYALSVLKQLYIEHKKPSEIVYFEGDKKINISSLKSTEYKIDKLSEKVKKIILDAEKNKALQRDYIKFTNSELKDRLYYYTKTELGDNEALLEAMIEFDSCKFIEEDKNFLIKFLQILDQIEDKKLDINDGILEITANNIKPRGTEKINEVERGLLEEKFKQEQEKIKALNNLRNDFNNAINALYVKNLTQVAENFSKYFPENLESQTIAKTKDIITIINESLQLEDSKKIKNNILRWQIFNDYLENSLNPEEFKQATSYAGAFEKTDYVNRVGQYLLNLELVNNYPQSKDLILNSEIFEKIMKNFEDKDKAVKMLCKYEDYAMLDDIEQKSLLKVLKIFDAKDVDDKIILKNIIENDYIKTNTVINNIINSHNIGVTFATRAKQAILEKYKFPRCIELFKAFEEAMSSTSSETGNSGIKRTGTNNNALEYKMEVKINGYTDRLFSSNNDYVFDVYSEKGLH